MAIKRTLSVLVPAFNEARNIEDAVRNVVVGCADTVESCEILVVDDGSTDGTHVIAERLAREFPQVVVARHERNLGIAAAYRTGLNLARMDYFTFVPGDNEVAPDSIKTIFGAVGSADLIVPFHGTPGRRPMYRRLLTWIPTTQLNLLFGWHLQYYQGPTVYPTALARALPITARGFFFLTEMLVHALNAGYTFVEVGLTHQQRAYGRSKAVSWSNLVDAQKTILQLWWDVRVRRASAVPRAQRDPTGKLLEVFDY